MKVYLTLPGGTVAVLVEGTNDLEKRVTNALQDIATGSDVRGCGTFTVTHTEEGIVVETDEITGTSGNSEDALQNHPYDYGDSEKLITRMFL